MVDFIRAMEHCIGKILIPGNVAQALSDEDISAESLKAGRHLVLECGWFLVD